MITWLVTGASRGLGFGLVRQILAASKDNAVFAACRDPSNAKQLTDLVNSANGRLHVVKLDVADESSIAEASTEVGKILVQRGLTLDYLINNAGISSGNDSPLTLKQVNFTNTLLTNAIAPMIVAQNFMPYLEKSKKPVIMNMSSGLGSIAQAANSGTFQTSYCTSKAALNMLTRKLSEEKRDVISFVMDPGWVKTGPTAALETDFSVSNMYKVLVNISAEDSGSFLRFDGKVVPW